ncbi:putative phosphodiesterase [Streptosporangium becharense]|uniref:Putative phosphodiesterase n=1 Tax=Streptosporangium becharense TaxID=1816182 RepID=A0A7W9IFB7_9ACTN|nr:metallophosphoesterase [Streptosporangium becharense]MBB2909366.1 putative phosphodiesterase [Streptosporangium becharense]MBB5819677.1 putative phosphodiesterase [Streptosporangium becharense]
MRFAIVGDIHANFAEADELIRRHAGPVEVIFSVGDAEPNRTEAESLEVGGPAKHRKVGDFPEFAAGRRTMSAPVHFIGGNHEPWPSLDAHGAGEWAPGFHFLGRSGVREIAGLRVAFLSGVYSRYFSEPDEPPEITPERLKEYGYFTRPHLDRLLRRARGTRIDLLLTHDWPAGLSYRHHGRIPVGRDLVRMLTDTLAPQVHACGHMHAPFRERVGGTDVICLSQVVQGADAVAVLELAPDGTLREVPCAE